MYRESRLKTRSRSRNQSTSPRRAKNARIPSPPIAISYFKILSRKLKAQWETVYLAHLGTLTRKKKVKMMTHWKCIWRQKMHLSSQFLKYRIFHNSSPSSNSSHNSRIFLSSNFNNKLMVAMECSLLFNRAWMCHRYLQTSQDTTIKASTSIHNNNSCYLCIRVALRSILRCQCSQCSHRLRRRKPMALATVAKVDLAMDKPRREDRNRSSSNRWLRIQAVWTSTSLVMALTNISSRTCSSSSTNSNNNI